MTPPYDVICIGAGPTGLASAIEAKRAGLRVLVIDKGCLCNSLFHYPVNMVFFTTPELLEIGDLPLVCAAEKPTRAEALKYYRKVVEHYELELRLGEMVTAVDGRDGGFTVHTRARRRQRWRDHAYRRASWWSPPDITICRISSNVPGEDLPHVSHYYTEAHSFWREDVVIIGGKNSAAEAALDLYRSGARVTLVHRGADLGSTIKYWVRPDIENRIKAGQIRAHFRAAASCASRQFALHLTRTRQRTSTLPAVEVFAAHRLPSDFAFSAAAWRESPIRKRISLHSIRRRWKATSPVLYLAGVVIGGKHTSEIFIENGRFPGKRIIAALTGMPLAVAQT